MAKARSPVLPRRRPGRPSGEERPGTRDALIAAAGRLIARDGAGQVSLRHIAAEAGVTSAMVHYYFGDKEGLYDAILERAYARLLERAREATTRWSDGESADARIADLLDLLTRTVAADPWIPTLVVREVLVEGGHLRERFIRDYASRLAELLPELMRRAIDSGSFRQDLDPRLAFLSFMGMAIFPFAARPVVEIVLGIDYDDEFVRCFALHTRRLFFEGAQS